MKKIIIYNDRWCSGGVESMIINILSNGDFSEFDIYLLVGVKETNIYDSALSKLNIHFISILEKTYNPILRDLKILRRLKKYLSQINPDLVHINACNSIGFKYSKIIKKHTTAKVIVQSHNTRIEKDKLKIKYIFHTLMKKYEKYVDYRLACSEAAGHFLFSKPFDILKNGVDLSKFTFNNTDRKEIRQKLNINNNEILLLNIGRLSQQKNQLFLIDILKHLDNNYKLLLIGEGENKQLLEEKIKTNGLINNIIILEPTNYVQKYYSAADLFLLPSLHEGLPVVGIEAQANGLRCFFSDSITKEIIISSNCIQLSINNPTIWSSRIKDSSLERMDNRELLQTHGYNIKTSSEKLKNIYIKL